LLGRFAESTDDVIEGTLLASDVALPVAVGVIVTPLEVEADADLVAEASVVLASVSEAVAEAVAEAEAEEAAADFSVAEDDSTSVAVDRFGNAVSLVSASAAKAAGISAERRSMRRSIGAADANFRDLILQAQGGACMVGYCRTVFPGSF